MSKFKPISELSDKDISEMTGVELRVYEDNVTMLVNEDRLAYGSKREKYHNLALILKKRTIDYATFQKEAYDLKVEMDTLKKGMAQHQVDYIQLKRDWERIHNINRVTRFGKSTDGKEILIQ